MGVEKTEDGSYVYRGAPTHETDVDARPMFHPSGDTYYRAYADCEQCDWKTEGDEGDVRGAAWIHEEASRPVTKLVPASEGLVLSREEAEALRRMFLALDEEGYMPPSDVRLLLLRLGTFLSDTEGEHDGEA